MNTSNNSRREWGSASSPLLKVEPYRIWNFDDAWKPFMKWLKALSLYAGIGGAVGFIIFGSRLYCSFAGSVC